MRIQAEVKTGVGPVLEMLSFTLVFFPEKEAKKKKIK